MQPVDTVPIYRQANALQETVKQTPIRDNKTARHSVRSITSLIRDVVNQIISRKPILATTASTIFMKSLSWSKATTIHGRSKHASRHDTVFVTEPKLRSFSLHSLSYTLQTVQLLLVQIFLFFSILIFQTKSSPLPPMPAHVFSDFVVSPPPRLWLKCNRLLRLGRPVGAVTLSR